MHDEYTTINSSIAHRFEDRINYHLVNTSLGVLCFGINLILLGIFLGYRPFRTRYVLLIQLCAGDLIYSLAVILSGLHRIRIYTDAYRTYTIPFRTTRECALQLWLLLKLIGDLFIPVTIFWMGIERFIAISFPLFYRMKVDGKPLKSIVVPFLSAIFVLTASAYAVTLAVYNDRPANYHCGRKVTFGEGFSTFVYVTNIFCNVVSTLLNAAAYIKAKQKTKKNVQQAQRQAHIIRYYLLISLLSTVLVSLPNTIALFQVYVQSVSDVISKPSVWMQTINSGIHLFVYLILNRDFRHRAQYLVRLEGSMSHHTKLAESVQQREPLIGKIDLQQKNFRKMNELNFIESGDNLLKHGKRLSNQQVEEQPLDELNTCNDNS
ncbi:hypothetical protein V3C99_010451 [Haemonchus contortus]|nr:7TM GPCR domain containing protein [Haemonchus contortus]